MNNGVTTQGGAASSTLLVSGVMFGISALVTVVFGYYLVADPTRLADAWLWVRGLPLAVQAVMWLVLLPWMIVLWVWSMPWALGVRLVIVVALLVATEFLLFPWKR